MAHHRGDDLDDDFMPDETVALSEDEGFASLVGDHDDIGKLLSADEDEGEQVDLPKEQPNLLSEKKRKRREKEKERKAKKRKFNEATEPGDHPSVASRSPAAISEYLSAMQAKSFSKMSALELQDRQIQDSEFYSGHDYMDGIEEFGHIGGFYYPSGTHSSHPVTAETQIVRSAHTTLSNRGSLACNGRDPCPQEQNAAR
jgi:protein CMS1